MVWVIKNVGKNKIKMEEDKEYKILGVYRDQSLIPALIMFVLHAFTTASSITNKVTLGDYKKLSGDQISDLQEWYFFYPTLFFAFFFLSRYFDYFFRDSKHKRLFGFLSCIIVGWILLLFFRICFMLMFFWNQI